MNVAAVVLALVLGIAIYAVFVYNTLQTLQTQIEAAIQEIGSQLKRQASLIPNLEASVKAFMKQEKSVFSMLTDARKSVAQAAENGTAANIDAAEKQLQAVLPKLQVVVEDNPELRSNETVQQFMAELRDTADKLVYSRRAVIDLSQQFNQKLVTFPSNFVAKVFGFRKQVGIKTAMSGSHVETTTEDMKEPKVTL